MPLAFDLGKADINTDNKVLESKETEWDVSNPDPDYHFNAILKAMKDTVKKLAQAIVRQKMDRSATRERRRASAEMRPWQPSGTS